MFPYESRKHPPLSRFHFVQRLLLHTGVAMLSLVFSLILGMAGYEYFEQLPWRDAFLNAAMLLGGMGPVNAPRTDAGKIFAGMYALYAGLMFVIVVGLILTPVVHRILHKFHWDADQ